jgi:mRNA-degrading endonuclease RelE of RelBE toxin-antitoxin system
MEIHYTAEFKRNLRHLMKKYPTIRSDLEPLLLNLQSGEICGDLVQHIGYQVYKVRLPNRDAKRGKSGGYRVIYYLQTNEHIILVTIYSKIEQGDINPQQIKRIIKTFDASS